MTAIEKFNDLRIKRVCENLKKRNMNPYYCKNVDELIETVTKLLDGCKTAASGGSVTITDSGIADLLRAKSDIDFLDRKECKDAEETKKLYHEMFNADIYFMSTSAITEDGELFNIDGTGNRLAALIYGPKKVVIVAGVNKLVSTVDEAILRTRSISAPMNAMRLNTNTPCTQDGLCHDCQSPESICSQFVLTRRSLDPDRIHVVLVDQSYGL